MQENNQPKYLGKYTLVRKGQDNKEVVYIGNNGDQHKILFNEKGNLETKIFTKYSLNNEKELRIKNTGQDFLKNFEKYICNAFQKTHYKSKKTNK